MTSSPSRPAVSPTDSPGNTLPKSARLLRRREFVRVQGRGRKLADGILLALVMPRPDGAPARLGITVSSKVGNAVVRARIRRHVREAFRVRRARWPAGVDVVVIARDGAKEAVSADFDRALERLTRRLERSSS